MGSVKEQAVVSKNNQSDEVGRGRLSVPALAIEYVEEIAEKKGMTKGEVILMAVSKLREELLAA